METVKVNESPIMADFEENYFGIEWISTENIIVDPNYQRPVKFILVKTISEAWDWRAVRTLAVSMRQDGTYAVMDGQQRLTAARECNITKLPCQVYIDLTEKQEAELFLKLNNSSKPSANDMFRAKIAEGDQEAKIIVIAVANTGWKLDLEATRKALKNNFCSDRVGSATALTTIYRRGGVMHLQQVLNIAHGWYGQHLAGGADILTGISGFLLKYQGKVDMSRLTEKFATESPSSLLGKANQVIASERSLSGGAETRAKSLVKVITALYNKGLRPANRLEE